MTRKTWIALAVTVVAAASLVVWLVRGLDAPVERSDGAPASSHESTSQVDGAASAMLDASAVDPASPDVVRTAPTTEESAFDDSELADAHWVEGRVVFPDGTPTDEEVWVVAKGRKFENRPLHRTRVGEDGRFRVAFSTKSKSASIDLVANYLYLREPCELKLAERPTDVVLEPLLGGRLRGRGMIPIDRPDLKQRAIGAVVQFEAWDQATHAVPRRGSLDSRLGFELRALPAGVAYELTILPQDMPIARRSDVRVEAGKVLEVECPLTEGARITGRVVDAQDRPVGGASLSARWQIHKRKEVLSAEDGTFELSGFPAGDLTIRVDAHGWLERSFEVERLSDGELRAGVVVRLERGATIAGRLQWPDGTPADGVVVRAAREGVDLAVRSTSEATTGSDGAFELVGLAESEHRVFATVKRTARGPWFADVRNVAAGVTDLQLTLNPGLTVFGRVVDDAGSPVTGFDVRAVPVDERSAPSWSRKMNSSFQESDGRYALQGLTRGRWRLQASAHGIKSQMITVEVSADVDVTNLVVPRTGRVFGRVVDAEGRPRKGVRVRRVTEDESSRVGTDRATTDDDGRFELDRVPIGEQHLFAESTGSARSATVKVDVSLGHATETELRLRAGGTVRGLLFDGQGRPQVGRKVWLHFTDTETDELGRFSFDFVEPGRWRLSVDGVAERVQGEEGELFLSRSELSRSVEVEEGGTVDLLLGGATGDAVRLRGRVSSGGTAVAGARVGVEKRESVARECVGGLTDDEGRYELILPGPGTYVLETEGAGLVRSSRELRVPPGSTCSFDVVMAGGVIRGHVASRSGDRLAGIQVVVELEPGGPRAQGERFGTTTTNQDGGFSLRGLEPGTYRVQAGGEWGKNAPWQIAIRSGVAVNEDGRAEEVGIVLDPAPMTKDK
jgi:hypothetical protein